MIRIMMISTVFLSHRVRGANLVNVHEQIGASLQAGMCEAIDMTKIETVAYFKHAGKYISPWHDIPLYANKAKNHFNFICEISKDTAKKFEISRTVVGNPIIQDRKDGKLRSYKWPRKSDADPKGPRMKWNYGALPQTWEKPDHPETDIKILRPGWAIDNEGDFCYYGTDLFDYFEKRTDNKIQRLRDARKWSDKEKMFNREKGSFWVKSTGTSPYGHKPFLPPPGGDNDPIDVVEIGATPMQTGEIAPVKILCVLALVDDDETDWKLIAVRTDNKEFEKINSLEDLKAPENSSHYDEVAEIREWLENYKTPTGKPKNKFGFDGVEKDEKYAIGKIVLTHRLWAKHTDSGRKNRELEN